ncbi:MAG: alternative ribosome rescue aminoacyl-tRNA hydrolase ArfB [Acidimicrobiales bacterium]
MPSYLVVDAGCRIPLDSVEWTFTTSQGPGGQHANRSHTRAIARIAVADIEGLRPTQTSQLLDRHGTDLIVSVDETRSQHRNREIALERLRAKVAGARVELKPRRATKPSRASKRRRVEAKRRRSSLKSSRKRPSHDD